MARSRSSSDSSSSSDSDDRHRHEKKHHHKKRKREKEKKHKHKKHEHKHKKHKHEKRDKEPAARSIITGKRIKREDGGVADAEGHARRQALLAHMNKGEDVVQAPSRTDTAVAAQYASARSDPALMMQLMQQSAELQRAKQERLGALVRTTQTGSQQQQLEQWGADDGAGPRDYKRERSAAEAGETRQANQAFGERRKAQ